VKPRFWHGPVASEKQAELIIGWAGWPFIVLSLGAVSQLAASFKSGDVARGIGAEFSFSIIFIPAFFLLRKRSKVAAIILFSLAMLVTILSVVTVIALARTDPGIAMGFSAVILVWLALTIQSWRAVRATRALPTLRLREQFD